MKFLLTGVIPAWFLALLFLGLSALTVVLYRRHQLPRNSGHILQRQPAWQRAPTRKARHP